MYIQYLEISLLIKLPRISKTKACFTIILACIYQSEQSKILPINPRTLRLRLPDDASDWFAPPTLTSRQIVPIVSVASVALERGPTVRQNCVCAFCVLCNSERGRLADEMLALR